MDEQLKTNLTSKKHWMRFLYMLFFAALFYVGFLVSWVVIVVQFVFTLITGDDSDKLRQFGSSLSQFLSQTLNYLTYNSEQKPFPLDEWPEPIPSVNASDDDTSGADTKEPKESEPVATEEKLASTKQATKKPEKAVEKNSKEQTEKAPKKTTRKSTTKTTRKKPTSAKLVDTETAGAKSTSEKTDDNKSSDEKLNRPSPESDDLANKDSDSTTDKT